MTCFHPNFSTWMSKRNPSRPIVAAGSRLSWYTSPPAIPVAQNTKSVLAHIENCETASIILLSHWERKHTRVIDLQKWIVQSFS